MSKRVMATASGAAAVSQPQSRATPRKAAGRTGRGRVVPLAAALAVAAGCATLLVVGRLDTGSSTFATSDCATACRPGPAGGTGGTGGSTAPGVLVPTTPEQHQGRSLPVSSATPPAAASSAPVSASALVQFKVTSHRVDGYRAGATITDIGSAPLTG